MSTASIMGSGTWFAVSEKVSEDLCGVGNYAEFAWQLSIYWGRLK